MQVLFANLLFFVIKKASWKKGFNDLIVTVNYIEHPVLFVNGLI